MSTINEELKPEELTKIFKSNTEMKWENDIMNSKAKYKAEAEETAMNEAERLSDLKREEMRYTEKDYGSNCLNQVNFYAQNPDRLFSRQLNTIELNDSLASRYQNDYFIARKQVYNALGANKSKTQKLLIIKNATTTLNDLKDKITKGDFGEADKKSALKNINGILRCTISPITLFRPTILNQSSISTNPLKGNVSSKAKSSTIFLFPIRLDVRFNFEGKDGGQILTNMNKNYEYIYKKLEDINNDVELTPETKITKINEQFDINERSYSLSQHLLSLVTRIVSYITNKQIDLTPEEEKMIMHKLDELKQQIGSIQKEYIDFKCKNLNDAISSYLEPTTDTKWSEKIKIKDKIITELDTLKSYINGSDGPVFIDFAGYSENLDKIKNLKSRIEKNNPPIIKSTNNNDDLGGGRTRRRQKKQRKNKKTQKKHKKKTRKQRRQRR